MRKDVVALLVSALGIAIAGERVLAQQRLVPGPLFDAVAREFSGDAAKERTIEIAQYHRIQGSPMMAEVAEKVVVPRLRAAGIEPTIEKFPSDGQTRYQTYVSPMGWDMRGGELWVESVSGPAARTFVPLRMSRYQDVPMSVSTYSKGGEWSGELVDVGRGLTDRDFEGRDLRGKVALASGPAGSVMREAVMKRGAVGLLSYPDPLDRPGRPDMVLYNSIMPRANEVEKMSGSFQISTNQYSQLKAWMQDGPVRVRGRIDATLGPGHLTLVHAYFKGTEHPEREIVITGHLDHPKWGANDNASGAAAMIEMARTIQALLKSNRISRPRLTIHLMWVPEFNGTMAYISKHPEARRCTAWDDPRQTAPPGPGDPCTVANLNLDMVGEDHVLTRSRFYLTRSPDSVPSFLDALLTDLLEQAKGKDLFAQTGSRNYWIAEMCPYAQGSDHDVFIGLGVPATMVGHAPDWTHHTSEDTLEKTDPTSLYRAGLVSTLAAVWMAGASEQQWQQLSAMAHGLKMADYAQRAARAQAFGHAQRLSHYERVLAGLRAGPSATESTSARSGPAVEGGRVKAGAKVVMRSPAPSQKLAPTGQRPRRLVIPPIQATALETMEAADQAWWREQQARFSGTGGSTAWKGTQQGRPGFRLLLFETVNFMDGRRTTAEIAELLSAEYEEEIDRAWVDRVVGILVRHGLVSLK
jgi:hypothetical protein